MNKIINNNINNVCETNENKLINNIIMKIMCK